MAFWRKLIVLLISVSILPLHSAGVADAASPIPVYVFAGQSNMVGGYAKTAELPAHAPHLAVPQSNVLFWGPTSDFPRRWGAIEPPTEFLQAVFRNGFGPELGAAYHLSRMHPGQQLAIFKFARNGTNLHAQWNPDRPFGLYRQMLGRLAYARMQLESQTGRPTRIAGFFWMQGESDANTWSTADAYGRNLTKLISRIRRDTHNASLPVVVGQIIDVRRWHRKLPYSDIVRYKQHQVASLDPHAFLVRTDDLKQEISSRIHFNTNGTVHLGYRMANPAFGL